MPKATWNGAVLAESDSFEEVEGNVYFPPESLKREFFSDSEKTSSCFWKGTASYFNVTVDGETNADCAWTYKEPKEKAASIKDHVAFWHGVEVTRD